MRNLEVTLKVLETVEEARPLGQGVVVGDMVYICDFCKLLLPLETLTNAGVCDKCYEYQNL